MRNVVAAVNSSIQFNKRNFWIDPVSHNQYYVGVQYPEEEIESIDTSGSGPATYTVSVEGPPGSTARIGEIPIARLVTGTRISLPVQVFHGRREGHTIWLSAAVHGDEIAGVEIIRRVTRSLEARSMNGTVIAVPIVNGAKTLGAIAEFLERGACNARRVTTLGRRALAHACARGGCR